jgi:lipopolysaccharide export system permease protein
MLRKLDRYIIGKFLGMFFFMIIIFVVIAVVFDISEKIDDFLKSNASVWEIAVRYYLNFCLYYGTLLSSLLIFLTVILVTSNLAQKSEIIAILAGGVSFRRLLVPYMMAATLLFVMSMLLSHIFIPIANRERLAFEEEHIRFAFNVSGENHHREIAPGTIAYFNKINVQKNVGYRFALEEWDKNGRLRRKTIASKAEIRNPGDGNPPLWELSNVLVRTFDASGNETVTYSMRTDTVILMEFTDFGQRLSNSSAMTYSELKDFIEEERNKGSSEVVYHELENHARTANAFAIFILTLIGVSISARKVRGGMGLHIAAGVLIGLIYIFVQKIATVAATNSGLDPLMAVWIPNAVFFLLGLYIYRLSPK